jgi:broad specificity phosphatase PhoE
MKITLVRHGETVDNAARRCQGHLPGKLNEKGIEQAKKVGERLKKSYFDVIIVSDLRRAVQTANEIVFYHKDAHIIYDARVRERNFGVD